MSRARRPLRIGLLGCGGIAQIAHLPALRKAHNVELVAVCDKDEKLARRMAARYGVDKVYTEQKDMCAQAGIEAVLNTTREQHHLATVVEAMDLGMHVLVEKPLAPTVEECEAMVAAARRHGVKLQMGCMKRHDPTLQRAQQFAREQMGQQLLVSGWCFDSVYHGRYVETLGKQPERGDAQVYPESLASPHLRDVMGYGVHSLDLVLWFGGPMTKVSTFGSEGDEGMVSVSLLEFASGALGTFQVVRTVQMDWTEGIQVHGAGGSVIAHTPFPYFHTHADVTIFDAAQQAYLKPAAPGVDMYQRQLEAFAQAIFDDGPVTPSGEDGLRDQQVILAMHESYKTGQAVAVGSNR